MPMKLSDYPANWPQISLAIRAREGWRCKWCGAANGLPHPVTGSKVVLTVAHLGAPLDDGSEGDKHNKHDVRPANLAALCQRCHLNYDRADHIAKAQRNRAAKRAQALALAGQQTLFQDKEISR